MIQTILFATDLCAFTPYMLQHVTALANHCRARIVVVHAVEPMGSLATAVVNAYLPEKQAKGFDNENLKALITTIKDKVIDLLADEFVDGEKGLRFVNDVIVEPGRPAEVILNHAAATNADIIMMGSHGPDPINGFSLGSVTHKVLQLAKVPVYMVPMLPMAASDNQYPQRQLSLW